MLSTPAAGEFGAHFGHYIGLVADRDVLTQLNDNQTQLTSLYTELTTEQSLFRYASGKWSLKEVLGHIVDTERIMSYRMLRIARGDQTPLPGFEENDYVAAADFDSRSIQELLGGYIAVRAATVSLITSIAAEAWTRQGVASGTGMSARAFAYVIAGHERHHLNIIQERYLTAL
ncbi:DinB family protein [Paenibacillus sp. R14(2021)]|uniref:DinB family protein n=1 Tax=Paenibacillus sp. R14(2021) TaxID=2859228 RepID=UPI001C615DEA|nr:DinB family protein [Paenibacillus sp. R14(2021)]